jgi:hypothetical protein
MSLLPSYRASSEGVRGGGAGFFLSGLRDDDSLLRQVFFSILRHHHPNLATKVRPGGTARFYALASATASFSRSGASC